MWKHGHAVFAGTLIALGMIAASAQTGGSGMIPSLGEAMPLEARDGAIVLARPIALAPGRILPAGTIFRNAFRIPDAKEIARANQGRNSSKLEELYSGRRSGISALEGDTRTEFERALEFKAREPAWSDVRQMAAFLHALPADDYYVAVQSTPEAKPEVVQLRFPEGLLLAQEPQGVRLLAVLADSPAGRAGLPPGSWIEAVGGTPIEGSLETFLRTLPRARRLGQESNGLLTLALRTAPGADIQNFSIRLPRSLSNTKDFFSDIQP
jgi:hypothetical protein